MFRGVFTFFIFFMMSAASFRATAQTRLAEYEIPYASTYQLQNSYTIIYDNVAAPVKINEIKIEFFNSDREKITDVTLFHPEGGDTEVHSLDTPIIGFNSIKLYILSLHSGSASDLPRSLSSILALSLEDEVPDIPINNPPVAKHAKFSLEAGHTEKFDLSTFYSDDREGVRLSPFEGQVEGLTFRLTNLGQLTVSAPAIIGPYHMDYTIADADGEEATGRILINVMMPLHLLRDSQVLGDELASLEVSFELIEKNFLTTASLSDDGREEIETLLADTSSLYDKVNGPEKRALKADADDLMSELNAALSSPDQAEILLRVVQNQLSELRDQLATFNEMDEGANITDIQQALDAVSEEMALLRVEAADFKVPLAPTRVQLNAWRARYDALKPGPKPKRAVLIVSAVLIFLGLIGCFKLFGKGTKAAPVPEKPPKTGVVFANSPLLAGAAVPGPAPLAPLGQLVPSGLQTLTGSFSVLKPAYRATGRIGGPQDGVPTNDDVAFGTGFLITPEHIMTNQHVYEFYKHYLTGPQCGGIEFIAERDRDASDYVAFDGHPPLIIEGLDIAIFKLSRRVTNRAPIERISIPTDKLNEREIVTISYPCPFELDDYILSAVEKDPIFAVKRLSQGVIFRHSTDTDAVHGVQVSVDARINTTQKLHAICHNASTLGGSSGAPILDLKGQLVGVHFAGERVFNGKEAANLAMAIEVLAKIDPLDATTYAA